MLDIFNATENYNINRWLKNKIILLIIFSLLNFQKLLIY